MSVDAEQYSKAELMYQLEHQLRVKAKLADDGCALRDEIVRLKERIKELELDEKAQHAFAKDGFRQYREAQAELDRLKETMPGTPGAKAQGCTCITGDQCPLHWGLKWETPPAAGSTRPQAETPGESHQMGSFD